MINSKSPSDETKDRSLVEQALHFGAAVVQHVADGCRNVEEQLYLQRLDISRNCDRCDVEQMICRECGCLLAMKARWGSEGCPLGLWKHVKGAQP